MRLNLKEFKDLINTLQGIVEFTNKVCDVFECHELELDKYISELYEEILTLCGYDDKFLMDKDPVLQITEPLNDTQLEEMYTKILQEISEYRISLNPDGDIY